MPELEIPRWPKRSLFWDPEEEERALQQLNDSRRERGLAPFGFELREPEPSKGLKPLSAADQAEPDDASEGTSVAQVSPETTEPRQDSFEEDAKLLARLIFAEAGNHFDKGTAMEGVAWAAANRVGAPGFPDTLHGVIHQPTQFAVGSPQWEKADNPAGLKGDDARAYARAVDVAKGVLSGSIPDPTQGAQFFYSSPTGRIPGGWFPGKIAREELIYTPDRNPAGHFYFLKVPPHRK
jgi:spore germination cell wall hydrolase CwlJ-like protein